MEARAPKLLVVDLDGTSLGGGYVPYSRFPDHYSRFLDQLHEQGCQWAVNTTWSAQGQLDLVKASAVKSSPCFLMAELGMRLWRLDGGRLEAVQPYNERNERAAAENNRRSFLKFISECMEAAPPASMNFYGHWFDMSCAPEDELAFKSFIAAVDWKARGIKKYSSSGCRLTAVHDFMGKDKSLREALAISGIAPLETVVAGDEEADIAMMAPGLSAFGICPSNAAEGVKRAVEKRRGIAGTKSHSDGVIEAFKKLSLREGWGFKLD